MAGSRVPALATQLLLLLYSPAAAAPDSIDLSQRDHKVSALIWLPEAVNELQPKRWADNSVTAVLHPPDATTLWTRDDANDDAGAGHRVCDVAAPRAHQLAHDLCGLVPTHPMGGHLTPPSVPALSTTTAYEVFHDPIQLTPSSFEFSAGVARRCGECGGAKNTMAPTPTLCATLAAPAPMPEGDPMMPLNTSSSPTSPRTTLQRGGAGADSHGPSIEPCDMADTRTVLPPLVATATLTAPATFSVCDDLLPPPATAPAPSNPATSQHDVA